MSKIEDYRKAQFVERILADEMGILKATKVIEPDDGDDAFTIETDPRVAKLLANEIRATMPALLYNAWMTAQSERGTARQAAEEEARALLAEKQHAEEERPSGPVTVCP